MSQTLIQKLQNPALYTHPVDSFRVIETHISWVLLTGDYAYKIKKPMDFGFLDFSTLDKRRFYCEEELRLNRRLAPDIYQDLISITGTEDDPSLMAGSSASAFEYAIRMRQFEADSVLANQSMDEEALSGHLRELIQRIAQFHENECEIAQPDHEFGTAAAVLAPVTQNFEQIEGMLESTDEKAQLDRVRQWALAGYEKQCNVMEERKRDGFVRECHGDLHLGNIAIHDDKALLFDCIEFNDSFRWIDVINDLAFLLMDLDFRDMPGLSATLLNDYLEITGDYHGATLLPFYKSYRAMVRCKIALFTLNAPGMSEEGKATQRTLYRQYLSLAENYARQSHATLLLTQGLSGSGKTTLSNQLICTTGAVRIRTDVERKRLAGLSALEKSDSELNGGIYTPELSQLTYSRLLELAEGILTSGQSVICDGTFLKEAHRAPFARLAAGMNTGFAICSCQVAEETARQWLTHREHEGRDAAEADFDIMLSQKQSLEPFTDSEKDAVVHFEMDKAETLPASFEHLYRLIGLDTAKF